MIRMSKEEIKKRYGLREGNQEKMLKMLCMISLFDWEFPMFDQIDEFFKTQPRTAIECFDEIWKADDALIVLDCANAIKENEHIFLETRSGYDEVKPYVKESWSDIFNFVSGPFPNYDELSNNYYKMSDKVAGTELEQYLEKPTIPYMNVLTVTEEGRILYSALRAIENQL